MAASWSPDPTAPQHPERSREEGADLGEGLRVLFHRPEICVAEVGGLVLLVQLTATRLEWLAPIQAAHVSTALRYGGPRPFIAIAKLDRRFPIDIGFDALLSEQRSTLDRLRPHFLACAVVVRFGGILGFTMHRAMQLIGFVAGGSPPMHTCSSAAEAVCWIEPHAAPALAGGFDRGHVLRCLRKLETLLGNED